MAHQITQVVDARNSTHNDVGRDQIVNYYGAAPSLPTRQPLSSLSLNDAPIDLLSSNFTGRKEGLDYITKVFEINHGSAPTHCAVYAIPGMGKTQLALQYARLSYHQ